MAQIFLNNCYATLAQAITASDTQIELSDMNGFPTSLGEGDFFLLTLYSDTTRYGENIEVVKVTGLSGTTLTVERGYEEGTFAHATGERVEARLTARSIQALADTPGALPFGTPDWPATLSYNAEGNLTAATYSQGVERYRQSLTYNATGNLATVLYERSTDNGTNYADIGIETLHYDVNGNVTHTEWTGA